MPKTTPTIVLYLTKDEQVMFEKLPEELKTNWQTEEEKGKYEDSDKQRQARLALLRVQDKSLTGFLQSIAGVNTQEELLKLAEGVDLSTVKREDLVELLFALGPVFMSFLVRETLSTADSADALEAVSGFSGVRHAFYLSFVS